MLVISNRPRANCTPLGPITITNNNDNSNNHDYDDEDDNIFMSVIIIYNGHEFNYDLPRIVNSDNFMPAT